MMKPTTHILLIFGLLIPGFAYSKSTVTRIKELEETAYLKALELQTLAKQIKEIQADNMITGVDKIKTCISPYLIDELCDLVLQKLKKKGIEVQREDLVAVAAKEEVAKSIEPHKKLIRGILEKIQKTGEWTKKTEKLAVETSELVNNIGNALSGEGQLVCNLSERLFDKEENSSKLNMLKFSFVQSLVEINLLHYLFDRYQSCLIELISINNELRTLKQKEKNE